MALIKGKNVYESNALEKANAYFATRAGTAAWVAADDETREAVIVSGTSIVDNKSYLGYAASETQTMAFPRVGSYLDERLGRVVAFPTTGAPARAIAAAYEMALHLLNNDDILESGGSFKKLEVGPIVLEGVRDAPSIPSVVYKLLAPLLARGNGGQRSLWRAG